MLYRMNNKLMQTLAIAAKTFAIVLMLCVVACSTPSQNDQTTTTDGEWTMLFNGADFDNFEKLNGDASYEVVDGAMVGTSALNTPNTFLATKEKYTDFILEVEVKVDEGLNSGIQIRSNSLPDYMDGRVHGYQVEIDPALRAWSGGIYDEARRGWLYPLDLNPEGRKAFVNGEWNKYRIECIGNSIRTWINGVPCADLVDDMTQEGFIAFQVHSIRDEAQVGKQVMWRDIKIKTENLKSSPWTDIYVVNTIPNDLSPQEEAQGFTLLFDGKTTEGWRGVGKDAFPEKGWKVEDGLLIVEKSDGGESTNGGDIVTLDDYSTFELKLDFRLTPGANSGIKYFITEGYGAKGSAIGLEYQLLDDDLHPDAKMGTAGNRTVGSLYDLIPAHKNKPIKKPGEWNQARLIVKDTRIENWPKGNNYETVEFKGAKVEHWLNYRKVLEYDRGTQGFYALVARSKYNTWENFGGWQSGRILLQDHGDEVHFRSIKVRKLD
ncbi:MAG: DUF1080 domain-containing protein [Cyclobacteriaceae bacterium]